MKTIFLILLITILDFSLSEKLECYDCSQTSSDAQAKCTENPTKTKKATDDKEYQVWIIFKKKL